MIEKQFVSPLGVDELNDREFQRLMCLRVADLQKLVLVGELTSNDVYFLLVCIVYIALAHNCNSRFVKSLLDLYFSSDATDTTKSKQRVLEAFDKVRISALHSIEEVEI